MGITGYPRLCPCGTGSDFGVCCGRLITGRKDARTAEELMRSRYSAYSIGDLDYIFRTWHPKTRPPDVSPAPGVTFAGLEVSDIVAGGPDDDMGVVEFTARLRGPDGGLVEMHERSRFSRRAGRWMYVDGVPDVDASSSAPIGPPTQLGQR